MALDCPVCDQPLQTTVLAAYSRHDCPGCAGTWVRRAEREALLAAEAAAREPGPAFTAPLPEVVVYHHCPECRAQMHRKQLGRVSGVVVAECVLHGTWFAAGQLDQAARFAVGGGAERTAVADAALAAERAAQEAARAARRAEREARAAEPVMPPGPGWFGG